MGQGRSWGCALCHARVAELGWSASGVRTTLGSSCQCFHEDVLSEVPPQVTSSAVTSCCQVTSCACSLSLEALLPSSHLAERYPPLMVLLQAHKLHVSKLSHISSPGCSCLRILAVGCVQCFPSTVGCGGFRYQLQGEGHPGQVSGVQVWKGQHRHGPICQEDAGHCFKVNLK